MSTGTVRRFALSCVALRCVLIFTRTRYTSCSNGVTVRVTPAFMFPLTRHRRPASSLILLPSDLTCPAANFSDDNSATRSSPIANINSVKKLRRRPVYPNSCLCSVHRLKRSYAAEIRPLGRPGTRARIWLFSLFFLLTSGFARDAESMNFAKRSIYIHKINI